jgi:Protein of unknown function (DUF616)
MRTVLYTCTNLAYDQIFTPVAPTPGVDFVLFADRRPCFVRGWQWRPLPPETAGMTPVMVNRFAKFFPHRIFPEADCSIYVDANTLMLSDLRPLIEEFRASGADIGLFPHKQRFNIFEEFEFARKVGKIPAADADRGRAQLAFYRAEGLPDGHLFTENAIIFRRHGSPALAPAMDLWWEQMERYTKRDQLSLPYVLHKTGLEVKLWDWNYKWENPYFKRYLHRRGALSDLNVLLKNKRYYNRFYDVVCGAALFAYHGLFKRLRPDPQE